MQKIIFNKNKLIPLSERGNSLVEAVFVIPSLLLFSLFLFDLGLLGLEKVFLQKKVSECIQIVEYKNVQNIEKSKEFLERCLKEKSLKTDEINVVVDSPDYLKDAFVWKFSFSFFRRFSICSSDQKIKHQEWMVTFL